MIQSKADKANDHEAQFQKALEDIQSGKYKGTRSAARAYGLSDSTLRYRMAGCNLRTNVWKSQQIFSDAEEKTLV